MTTRTKWIAAAAALTFAAGCGSKAKSDAAAAAATVRGRVVVKGDPLHVQRLEGGTVRLQSQADPGLVVAGVIDHDGTFAVAPAAGGGEGFPPGVYRVAVEPPREEVGKPRTGVLPASYTDFTRSRLSVTLPPAEGDAFEVVVERQRR